MHLLLLLMLSPIRPCKVQLSPRSYIEVPRVGHMRTHQPMHGSKSLTSGEIEMMRGLPECNILPETSKRKSIHSIK